MFAMKPTEPTAPKRVVRVGIVGCGMQTQVVHIPTLNLMSHMFRVTYLYDASADAMAHCRSRVVGGTLPNVTHSVEELCSSDSVDLIMIATSDTFHLSHTTLGLKYNKPVFLEKPLALTLEDADKIIAAEKASQGGRVFVGYMRRHAAAFADVLKEVGDLGPVRYARVRDIIGSNSIFISQSGAFPRTFGDYKPEDTQELREGTSQNMKQALEVELGVPLNQQTELNWQLLSSLGSHDLSAMREIFGMPEEVLASSLAATGVSPFWSCLFRYQGFTVSYESGVDNVARFDASIEIFGDNKTVKLCIDTPFVKGLPITMRTQETVGDGALRDSVFRRTYEDPFTLQMKEVHDFVVEGKTPNTTVVDARQDIVLLGMIMRAAHAKR